MTVDEALKVCDTEKIVYRETWPEVAHVLAAEVRRLREELNRIIKHGVSAALIEEADAE